MKANFVDCFLLMNTAISIDGAQNLPEMGRPILYDVFTTIVNISLSVEELKISSTNNNIEAHLIALLSQYWIDPRLGANVMTRRKAIAGQIWKPEITNVSGKKLLTNCDKCVFWRGYGGEGNVLYSEKIQLQGTCTGYLQRFPFDTQLCQFKFGSYRFPEDEVSLNWRNPGVILKVETEMKEFKLTNISTFTEIDIRDSGNFSVAVIQLSIERHSRHYIFCMAVPCFVLIFFSYSTLWFGLKKLSARLTASVVCFGLLLFLYYISVCSIYPVPYLKALDIFVIINLGFALLIILDTIISKLTCNIEEMSEEILDGKIDNLDKKYKISFCKLFMITKVVFPLIYIFSIILYHYLYINKINIF